MKGKLYNEFAAEYAEVIKDNVFNAQFDRPSLCALSPDVCGKQVLDMGCGPGEYTKILVEKGAEVTAIDISEKFIEIITKRFENISAYVQDLNLGLPKEESGKYDIVISPLTIHYVEDLKSLFREVSRVLKPKGLFLFSTHSPIADGMHYKPKNYYKTELVTDTWNTIGKPVEVQFYRRPLTEIFQAIFSSAMCIIDFSEGIVGEKIKDSSERNFQYLSTQPNFIYVKCRKEASETLNLK